MKIAYLGVYKDGSGYSQASLDYLLAMDSVGLEVQPVTLHLNGVNNQRLPKRFFELEKKKLTQVDVVIQHYLPSLFEYNGNVKNIGLFAWETDRLPPTWVNRINQMLDEVWVINNQQKQACIDSNIKKTIKVVPHAVNVEKFSKTYEPLDQIRNVVNNNFIFYTVCEFGRRKNLEALLRAFHSEFEPYEPVELILKVNKTGLSDEQTSAMLSEFCKSVKTNLRKFNNVNYHKRDITITNNVSEDSLMRLHSTCDCYVNSSFGEAWSIPTVDSIGLGKAIIAPAHTGFLDYLDDSCAWLVPTYKVPCFAADNDLYSSDQNWWQIDINELKKTMRKVYNEERQKKSVLAKQRVYDYSYQKIGNLIKGILHG